MNRLKTDAQLLQADVSGSGTKQELKVFHFQDAVKCKLKNRQVIVHRKNKQNLLRFVRLAENNSDIEVPSCAFNVLKNKVCVTELAISDEALEALHVAIGNYLRNGCLTDR